MSTCTHESKLCSSNPLCSLGTPDFACIYRHPPSPKFQVGTQVDVRLPNGDLHLEPLWCPHCPKPHREKRRWPCAPQGFGAGRSLCQSVSLLSRPTCWCSSSLQLWACSVPVVLGPQSIVGLAGLFSQPRQCSHHTPVPEYQVSSSLLIVLHATWYGDLFHASLGVTGLCDPDLPCSDLVLAPHILEAVLLPLIDWKFLRQPVFDLLEDLWGSHHQEVIHVGEDHPADETVSKASNAKCTWVNLVLFNHIDFSLHLKTELQEITRKFEPPQFGWCSQPKDPLDNLNELTPLEGRNTPHRLPEVEASGSFDTIQESGPDVSYCHHPASCECKQKSKQHCMTAGRRRIHTHLDMPKIRIFLPTNTKPSLWLAGNGAVLPPLRSILVPVKETCR